MYFCLDLEAVPVGYFKTCCWLKFLKLLNVLLFRPWSCTYDSTTFTHTCVLTGISYNSWSLHFFHEPDEKYLLWKDNFFSFLWLRVVHVLHNFYPMYFPYGSFNLSISVVETWALPEGVEGCLLVFTITV
jgi:hypothetical protein